MCLLHWHLCTLEYGGTNFHRINPALLGYFEFGFKRLLGLLGAAEGVLHTPRTLNSPFSPKNKKPTELPPGIEKAIVFNCFDQSSNLLFVGAALSN